MPGWLKTTLTILGGVIVLFAVILLCLTIYVSNNKTKVLALINTELKKSFDGTVQIGGMNPSFFKSFPGVSLTLKNVIIRDKRFNEHHRTLLDAKDFDISVNTAALLRGAISVNHVDISNASIDIYTDTSGYSNTSVFNKSAPKKKDSNNSGSSATEVRKFKLDNINLTVDDRKAKKLFKFEVEEIKGNADYPDTGWNANVHIKVLSKSLGFNMQNGPFLKNKTVEADLKGGGNNNGRINVQSDNFNIGGDDFKLRATFAPINNSTDFSFHITNDAILWKHAAAITAANINQTLYMFDIEKPIALSANISGNFNGGDPLLYITTVIANNKLTIPGAVIENCNFNALFTNVYDKNKPLGDPNSVIKLTKFTGTYNHLPFRIDSGSIINLVTPIATGNFSSRFPLTDLNYTTGKYAKFANGTADLKLHYKADVINLRLNKPLLSGNIVFKNADVTYTPKQLHLKNSSLALHFVGDNLVMNNIRFQSGRSIVYMDGKVNNFLNLYYTSPEKIVLNWNITSPQMYLAEFIGFLNKGVKAAPSKTASPGKNSGNVIDQLGNVIDRSKADMHLRVANLHYKKFLATNVVADLESSEDGIVLKKISLKHSDGSLLIKGKLVQNANSNLFNITTTVNSVDIHEFFYAFDNFGLSSPTYQNLKGQLSADVNVTGAVNGAGSIIKRSINGAVNINLKNGALIDYGILKSVGKYAFPFRRMGYITIPKLDAKFDIKGDKIIINPMQLTSSAINADIAGVYDMSGKVTDIKFDVPLRNPKNDTTITDKDKLQKKRYRGIVLHLAAKNNDTGGIKIGFQ